MLINSISKFFDKLNAQYWLFGFIIAFIVLSVFFIFIDGFLKFQKKNNLDKFHLNFHMKQEPKKIKDEEIKIKSPKKGIKVKRPSRRLSK